MTVFVTAGAALADALTWACVACVCMDELKGTGTCSDRRDVGGGGLDLGTVTAFVVVGLVIVVLAVHTYRRERARRSPDETDADHGHRSDDDERDEARR